MKIDYELTGAGWATVTISVSDGTIKAIVSYLHDSLKQLAEAALHMSDGGASATVVFMDEPGEHHLVLERAESGDLSLEARWFDDWASWKMYPADQFKVLLSAETTVNEFHESVAEAMDSVLQTWGIDGYKEKWGEHEFPSSEFDKLLDQLTSPCN